MQMLHGDCREVMATLPENSVDAIVTDPPYGLEFMGKEWDRLGDVGKASHEGFQDTNFKGFRLASYNASSNVKCQRCEKWRWDYPERKCVCTAPEFANVKAHQAAIMQSWHESWAREAYRVLKPGGHLLAFGGSRTYHRLACAIEDAGFEIRDQLQWLYGSGFPKSHDVSKAMDKAAGAEREVVGQQELTTGTFNAVKGFGGGATTANGMREPAKTIDITAPATDLAHRWQGFGTALKPAHEPIVLARKPLIGTVAVNVAAHGTGALNIDGCRIEGGERPVMVRTTTVVAANAMSGESTGATASGEVMTLGRWPANVCLDEDAAALLDAQSGERKSGSQKRGPMTSGQFAGLAGDTPNAKDGPDYDRGYLDTGGASRFFYCAKSSRTERNMGLGSTCTVKYTFSNKEKELCEATVQLLKKATSDIPTVSWHIGESGASITAQCPRDSLSTTLTAIRQITTSTTLNWSTLSRTSDCTADANCETANGGSPAESAESSNTLTLISTNARTASPQSASSAASDVLSLISDAEEWKPDTNFHPTCKPVSLMRWLCRLITPPGGTVLDPFMGSGTTGIAAALEGFDFVGIEQDAEYLTIAERRIAHWTKQPDLGPLFAQAAD